MTARQWLDRTFGLSPEDLPDTDAVDWDADDPGEIEAAKDFIAEEMGFDDFD